MFIRAVSGSLRLSLIPSSEQTTSSCINFMRFQDESNYPQAIQFFSEERSHLPPADPTTRPTTTEARRGEGRIQQSPPSIFQLKRTEFTSTQSPIQISKIFSKKQSPKKMTCKRISCQNFNERKCKTSSSQPFTETSEKKASSWRRPRRSPRRRVE